MFNALRSQDYSTYAQTLLDEREVTLFPPFSYLAIIRAEAKQFSPVQQFLVAAGDYARELTKEVKIYDPLRPQMEKLKGMERGQVIMQSKQRAALQTLLKKLTPYLRTHALSQKVRWVIDVDPLEI